MNKYSEEEKVAITQMVEDIMAEDHDLLASLNDDDEDCEEDVCSCCGGELEEVSLQWLVLLEDGRFAVHVDDDEDYDYRSCLVVIEPVPNAAGLFKEHPSTIYTLANIIDEDLSMTTLPILLERVGLLGWVVVEGQACS